MGDRSFPTAPQGRQNPQFNQSQQQDVQSDDPNHGCAGPGSLVSWLRVCLTCKLASKFNLTI